MIFILASIQDYRNSPNYGDFWEPRKCENGPLPLINMFPRVWELLLSLDFQDEQPFRVILHLVSFFEILNNA